MAHARIPTSEQLLAEMAWIRRLARALVKDAAVADDLAQEAWLVAHAQQPAEDRPLRPWLARVVVNLVRTRRRGEVRREQRDATYDDGRIAATPAELIERVELQRALADEVLALAEPFRSTVVLHFFEGLTSAEIARKLGVPDGTVRRRLKVALDRLREALRERKDQPQHGWLAALVPFASGPEPSAASASIGVIAMKKVIGVVVLLLLLLAIGGGLLWRRNARRDHAEVNATAPASRQPPTRSTDATTRASSLPPWVVVADAPPRRIAGKVIARGAPVAGATVMLGVEVTGESSGAFVALDSVGRVLHPIAEVTSAADGTFDFGVQPPTALVVSASTSRHAAALADVSADPRVRTDLLVLELGDCQARLFGTVADGSGGGIANARVTASGLGGTETDARGTYSLCIKPRRALGSPSAELRVEADGYGTIREDVLAMGELQHDFLLVPEAVLVGRVMTTDGGPVMGARVVAGAAPSAGPRYVASGWATSDGEGRFRIAGLAPGSFQLTASAPGMRSTTPLAVVARATTTSRELLLVVAPLARVRGQVVSNGAPVQGANVTALHVGHGPAGTTLSEADGSFVLDGVPYGTIQFFAPPYQLVRTQEMQVERAEVIGITLEVTKMASLRGRVTRGDRAVAGADVMFMAPPQALIIGAPPFARTDASGAFLLEGLPPGPGRVVAWDNDGKAFSTWQNVELTAGEDKTVDVALDRSGEVKGTIIDETDQPLAGVYVRMDITDGTDDMCEALTDRLGQFDCAMLIGGRYRPTVAPAPGGRQSFAPVTGDAFALVDVPANDVVTGITLRVKNERVAIKGRVVDDSGAPVADVDVEAIGRGFSTMATPSARSDTNGRFAIDNLARGSYAVAARGGDGSERMVMDVVAGGAPVTIVLARAGRIAGTLAGFATTPIVEVSSIGPNLRIQLAIVDGTTFSVDGLAPGRYLVQAKAPGATDGQLVEVRAGAPTRIALRARGTGTVIGTVLDFTSRTPIAGMRCDAKLSVGGTASVSPPDLAQQTYTDAAGRFTVSAPVGRSRIVCFAPNGGLASPAGTDVDVASGVASRVDVFSVAATFGATPTDAGFALTPHLPLTVGQVLPVGPAAAAGVRPGDELVSLDGAPVAGLLPEAAMTLVMNHPLGTNLELGVMRGGVAYTFELRFLQVPR